MSIIDVSYHRTELGRIETELSKPEVVTNHSQLKKLTRQHSQFREIVETADQLQKLNDSISENQEMLISESDDEEFVDLANEEIAAAQIQVIATEKKLTALLLPKDPDDDANAIIEIRAGTGGEEASLFASELFRMYTRYSEDRGWKVDTMNTSYTGLGGLKEVTFGVEGPSIYSLLKYEAGVHRVQRVPETETSGRIHTSAASVAVLPELEDVAVEINAIDIRVDVYRASGPGGQSVNTTDSAVRITHIASGLVVTCQDEKSQHKNKAKAMRVLKARLYEKMQAEAEASRSDQRRSMVRTGDRSEKIRTYNYPQNRVTDHRIHLTVHALEAILAGDLDRIIQPLIEHDTNEKIKAQTHNES